MPRKKTYTKEKHRALNLIWSRNGKACVAGAKSRSKSAGIPFDIDWNYAMSVMPKDMVDVFGGQMKWKDIDDGRNTPGRQSPTLDRINPANGYVKGNVQWLTQEHNRMKQDFTHEQLVTKLQCLLANLQLSPICKVLNTNERMTELFYYTIVPIRRTLTDLLQVNRIFETYQKNDHPLTHKGRIL